MSAKVEPLLTIDDLEAMPDDGNRYELFEGEIFVSRAPSLSHQRILANLLTLIRNYLEQNPIGEVLPTPGVIFDEFDSAIPDIVFITNRQVKNIGSGERILEAPALAIEIVSPGKENARRDREVKRQVYGKFGVREYWIANPELRALEIYRLKRHTLTLAATHTNDDEITTPVLPGFKCNASRIFSR
ncbi:MAG TPA: Uma2 family endonuclease [Pyrinomonadaceae bacterium]|nr:Uma2 family endonuclease [Pyrinomonadaceae bacterium]